MKRNELIKIVVMSAYNLYLCSLRAEGYYEKVTVFKVGDLVLEISSINFDKIQNFSKAVGRVSHVDDNQVTITDLTGKVTVWHKINANYTQFIRVPETPRLMKAV